METLPRFHKMCTLRTQSCWGKPNPKPHEKAACAGTLVLSATDIGVKKILQAATLVPRHFSPLSGGPRHCSISKSFCCALNSYPQNSGASESIL